jgi:RND family efflux transporter MFP subunit
MDLVVPALEAISIGEGELSGRVDSVSPAADPRSMLYAVRLLVPNPDGRLRGGMLARLRVPLQTKRGALLVPERATFSENGADYVLVVREGKSLKRLVKLGDSDGTSVEALEGLAEGELVVTAGQEFLGDGDPVAIAP